MGRLIVVSVACELGEIAQLPRLWSALTPSERALGARRVREADRLLFAAGRAALREAFAMAGCAYPGTIADQGMRPRLDGPPGDRFVFSIAHTAGLALCALAPSCRLGIDVERVDRTEAARAIEQLACSEAERRALPDDRREREQSLLRLWTRKEAAAKALGLGLAADFRRVLEGLDPSCRVSTERRGDHVVSLATDWPGETVAVERACETV